MSFVEVFDFSDTLELRQNSPSFGYWLQLFHKNKRQRVDRSIIKRVLYDTIR